MANLSSFYTTSPLVTANVVSTLTANNANFLAGNAANTYASLANPTFTGNVVTANIAVTHSANVANLYVSGTTTVAALVANGSLGTNGQVLTTNGTSTAWTTPVTNPVGTIITAASGTTVDSTYIPLNGQKLLQSAYPSLYSIIGVRWQGAFAALTQANPGLYGNVAMAGQGALGPNVMILKANGNVYYGNANSGINLAGGPDCYSGVGLVFNNNVWVASTNPGSPPYIQYNTTNGASGWSTPTTAPNTPAVKIKYMNGRYITFPGATGNSAWTATNVNSWSAITGTSGVYNGAYGNGVYVFTANGVMRTSTDLVNWTNNSISLYSNNAATEIVWTGRQFHAACGTQFMYSTDGYVWHPGFTMAATAQDMISLDNTGRQSATTTSSGWYVTGDGVSYALYNSGTNQNYFLSVANGSIYSSYFTGGASNYWTFFGTWPTYSFNTSTEFVLPAQPTTTVTVGSTQFIKAS